MKKFGYLNDTHLTMPVGSDGYLPILPAVSLVYFDPFWTGRKNYAKLTFQGLILYFLVWSLKESATIPQE
jgi:hypothetical protein